MDFGEIHDRLITQGYADDTAWHDFDSLQGHI